MITNTLQVVLGNLSQANAEEYLVSLQDLAVEVDRAMDALVSNALRSFEESVVRQRALCERLASLSRRSPFVGGSNAFDESVIDAGFAERVAEASAKLRGLNDRYSALLKHSGDTLRMFAGLFRGYSAPMRVPQSGRISIHNWSCEL